MAITVDQAFVNEYASLVRQLAQQKPSYLRPKVYEVSSGGKSYAFERLGQTSAVQKTARRLATVYVDDDWSRRLAIPQTWNHTMTIEQEDQVQMLVDPQSNYAMNQAYAMNRAVDDLIIAAATGDALDGNSVAVVFDDVNQKVGDGLSNISFDLVTQVQEKFMENEIMPDEQKCMVVSPAQVRKLMQLTEQTSDDYVKSNLQQLSSTGIALGWMGFDWVVSNRLTAPVANVTDCFAFTRRGIGLAVNQDVVHRIGEDPGKSYMTQVFSQWTMGATRVEDEHVVKLQVLD